MKLPLLDTEPVVIAGVVEAAVLCGSVFVFHWSPDQIAAATGLAIAATKLFVRQRVIPTPAVAEKATQVGTQVAANLTTTTVGAVGTVTDKALDVVNNAVTETLGGVL